MIQVLLAGLIAILCAGSSTTAAADLVELQLIDRLDEPRGFCLDIVGSKTRARPERGLQAHTCYGYQGAIAVDQGFDEAKIMRGAFLIAHFNLCMSAAGREAGTRVKLEPCDNSDRQSFALQANGEIISKVNRQLCLTVAAGESRAGGGGDPVHLIRRLSFEPCAADQHRYQRWRLSSIDKSH